MGAAWASGSCPSSGGALRRPWKTSRQRSEQNRRDRRVFTIVLLHDSQGASEPRGADGRAAGVLVSEIRARFSTAIVGGSARPETAAGASLVRRSVSAASTDPAAHPPG